MRHAFFVSTGFAAPGDPGFPPIDGIAARSLFKKMADYALRNDDLLVVRDHPATTPMLRILMEDKPDHLVIVPKTAPAARLAEHFRVKAAFFVCGDGQAFEDFQALENASGMKLVPFAASGGAAASLADADRAVKAHPNDAFGFVQLRDAMG